MTQEINNRQIGIWIKTEDSKSVIEPGEICVGLYKHGPYTLPLIISRCISSDLFIPIQASNNFDAENNQPDYVLALPVLP